MGCRWFERLQLSVLMFNGCEVDIPKAQLLTRYDMSNTSNREV